MDDFYMQPAKNRETTKPKGRFVCHVKAIDL